MHIKVNFLRHSGIVGHRIIEFLIIESDESLISDHGIDFPLAALTRKTLSSGTVTFIRPSHIVRSFQHSTFHLERSLLAALVFSISLRQLSGIP